VGGSATILTDPTGLQVTKDEPPGYSEVRGWAYDDKEYDWTVTFAGMSIDVHGKIENLRASLQLTPVDCDGIKWQAYVNGTLKMTFAASKRKGLWTELLHGRNYRLWYQISVSGGASVNFLGSTGGVVCPPDTLKGRIDVGGTASTLVIPTGSAGISVGEHLRATSMITGTFTAKVSMSGRLNLETGALQFSVSPPKFTGTASAYVFVTVRKPDGTDLTDQFSKEIF
jgi:hypothetical protein